MVGRIVGPGVLLSLFLISCAVNGLKAPEAEAPEAEVAAAPQTNACVLCHMKVTPLQVEDWRTSLHAEAEITCEVCHGEEHTTADDVAEVGLPTTGTCEQCHGDRVAQFLKGKHAKAWVAMNAMPATHYQPMELVGGRKGCGGCHKIGVKSADEAKRLKAEGLTHGGASCDSCHTRHTFAAAEAREPEACSTCHMGFDHPQYEMWFHSKHGVRHTVKRLGLLPKQAQAPTCQTCHMPGGNHEVRTAWGFLAVRLPLPEDKQWASDRVVILKGLGVLDPDGKPTDRLEGVKAADTARLTQESFQAERDRMMAVCTKCHSGSFAAGEIRQAEELIRKADRLMAEAIETVASLYRDGIIQKPESQAFAYPDLLMFNESSTPIEHRLFRMFLEHRMRTFQGAFHANPDYAFWYGWSEMRSDLAEIKAMAQEMRGGPGTGSSPR